MKTKTTLAKILVIASRICNKINTTRSKVKVFKFLLRKTDILHIKKALHQLSDCGQHFTKQSSKVQIKSFLKHQLIIVLVFGIFKAFTYF